MEMTTLPTDSCFPSNHPSHLLYHIFLLYTLLSPQFCYQRSAQCPGPELLQHLQGGGETLKHAGENRRGQKPLLTLFPQTPRTPPVARSRAAGTPTCTPAPRGTPGSPPSGTLPLSTPQPRRALPSPQRFPPRPRRPLPQGSSHQGRSPPPRDHLHPLRGHLHPLPRTVCPPSTACTPGGPQPPPSRRAAPRISPWRNRAVGTERAPGPERRLSRE